MYEVQIYKYNSSTPGSCQKYRHYAWNTEKIDRTSDSTFVKNTLADRSKCAANNKCKRKRMQEKKK